MAEIVERTARLENEARTSGIDIKKRMELLYLRMATCQDNEMEAVMEERAILREDVHLAEIWGEIMEEKRRDKKEATWKE